MQKRIDLSVVPVVTGCRYPAPFDAPCMARSRQRLGAAAALTDGDPAHAIKLARSAQTCFETPADWTASHTNIPPRIVSINRGRQDSCAPRRSLPGRPTQRPRRSFHSRCASRSRRVRLRGLGRVAAGDDCEQAQAALPHNPVLACSMQLQSIPYGKPPKKSDSGRISNIGNNRRCYAGASEM
jgi:hypothetical protein